MGTPQVIDLRNKECETFTATENGITRFNPFPEGGDVDIRLLKLDPWASTQRHNHTEIEFWTILSGRVKIYLDASEFELKEGESIRIDATRMHKIEALDSGAVMQAVWWHDRARFEKAITNYPAKSLGHERILMPAMLTPNGQMHIGHASGPFLYADILARILRLGGTKAFVAQGTHGHYEHIAIAASAKGLNYYDLAEENTRSFQDSMNRLGMAHDFFLGTKPDHRSKEVVLEVFQRLQDKGVITQVTHDVPFDTETDQFCVAAHVHGNCPVCGSESTATECESCGAIVLDAHLVNPVNASGHALERRPLKRLFLDLSKMSEQLEAFISQNLMPLYVKLYVEKWLRKGLGEICISNPGITGIEVPVEGFEDQRFNVVMEYAPRHLLILEQWSKSIGNDRFWHQIPEAEMPKLDILFGTDNSFGRVLVLPCVMSSIGMSAFLPSRVFPNHMLTLDGDMFSTSRNHAIWVKEFVTSHNREALRFYLCKIRPAFGNSDFVVEDFQHWQAEFWQGTFDLAVRHALELVRKSPSHNTLAEPGQFSADETAVFAITNQFCTAVKASYLSDYPDVKLICQQIETFVSVIDGYALSARSSISAEYSNEAIARSAARLATQALVSLAVALVPYAPDRAEAIAGHFGLENLSLDMLDLDWMSLPVGLQALIGDIK